MSDVPKTGRTPSPEIETVNPPPPTPPPPHATPHGGGNARPAHEIYNTKFLSKEVSCFPQPTSTPTPTPRRVARVRSRASRPQRPRASSRVLTRPIYLSGVGRLSIRSSIPSSRGGFLHEFRDPLQRFDTFQSPSLEFFSFPAQARINLHGGDRPLVEDLDAFLVAQAHPLQVGTETTVTLEMLQPDPAVGQVRGHVPLAHGGRAAFFEGLGGPAAARDKEGIRGGGVGRRGKWGAWGGRGWVG